MSARLSGLMSKFSTGNLIASVSSNYRKDIDSLRGMAIIFVVIYHVYPSALPAGFVGVDMFFVISGFLITTLIVKNNSYRTLIYFYLKRINRIFPALLIVLAFTLLLGYFKLLGSDYKSLGLDVLFSTLFVQNILYLNQIDYFNQSLDYKYLLHLWSLAVEEQFYIFYPLLIIFLKKNRFNLIKIILLLCAISFLLDIVIVRIYRVAAFYLPFTRFWELSTGGIAALLYINNAKKVLGDNPKLYNAVCIIGVTLLIISAIISDPGRHNPDFTTLFPVIGTTLLLISRDNSHFNNKNIFDNILIFIGLLSYPIYLWHWPLLVFIKEFGTLDNINYLKPFSVFLSLILSYITVLAVELPIRRSLNVHLNAAILVLISGLIGAIGAYIYYNDGLNKRLPYEVREMTSHSYDYEAWYRQGTCLLRPDQDHRNFKNCEISSPVNSTEDSILLWGDSHAAALFPGYQLTFGNRYKIIQLTSSGCAPILDQDFPLRPMCRANNNYVLDRIKIDKPDKIILHAVWTEYEWRKLTLTIDRLRELGIKDIELVGPVPQWKDTLPKQLYIHYKNSDTREYATRMSTGLKSEFIDVDINMAEYALYNHIKYLSPRDVLCDQRGCLTRLGEDAESYISFDYAHLTKKGSEYVVQKLYAASNR